MSARVIKGGALDALVIPWQGASSPVSPASPASLYSSSALYSDKDRPPMEEGPGSTPNPDRLLELELHIRGLEQEMEGRAQAALQKGKQQGLEQGRQQGDADARQQMGAQVEGLMQKLSRTIEEISGLRQRFRHEAEEDVVKLALAIARRVLHRELTIDPGAMLGLVKAALDQLDAREVHRLRVHPDQAAALQENFEKMGLPRRLQVEGDHSLERGAALFETTRGTLDASAETQLAEIERGFTDLVRHVK